MHFAPAAIFTSRPCAVTINMPFHTCHAELQCVASLWKMPLLIAFMLQRLACFRSHVACQGLLSLIKACGTQTGSGKTYTLQGTDEAPGVTTQALSHLFDTAAQPAAAYDSCTMTIAMLEIYNDAVHDLLGGGGTGSADGSATDRSSRGGSGTGASEPATPRETPRSARKSLRASAGADSWMGAGGRKSAAEGGCKLEVRSDASGAHAVGAHLWHLWCSAS